MDEGEEKCDQKQEPNEKQLISALLVIAKEIDGLGCCVLIAAVMLFIGLCVNGCYQINI